MVDYQIGKVIGVFGGKIEVSLLELIESDDLCIGVSEDMCINITSEDEPYPLIIGQPGSFVQISLPNGSLLAMITDIKMREKSFLQRDIKEAEEEDGYLIENPERVIFTVPVGTIDPAGKFERGSDILPTVNAKVYAVTMTVLEKVYQSYAKGDFTLGKLSLIQDQDAKINLDIFLGRHAAIIGQTGTGKSWTVASILQKLSNFPRSTVILLDLHGEYKNSFKEEYADYISARDLEFPYWLMNFHELLGLMIDQSEVSAPNQVAVFRDLLQEAKENYEENVELAIPKITIDTPIFFDFISIIEKFKELDTQMVPGARANTEKKGPYFGHFTRLITRIESRLNDKRYDLIFKPNKYTSSASMEGLFRKLLGENDVKSKKIIIIDISPIPMEVRNSVISLLLRCIFDFCYWYKRTKGETYPISVCCDEAHSYLNDTDSTFKASRNSAEKIAKEGRKYGISLIVVTQRPREVSATILSQCNSFMCMRITNPDDQIYVRRMLPENISGIISMFSTLRRGECILLGDSVIMPSRIKLDLPNPTPSSEDTSFYDEWNKEHTPIDINSILDSWRKQED